MKLTTLACVLGTFLATHPVYAQLVTDALLPCSANPHQLTIPDQGWRLWPDTQAPWQNDTLYLPSEVNLPLVELPDLLMEVDGWTGFSRHLIAADASYWLWRLQPLLAVAQTYSSSAYPATSHDPRSVATVAVTGDAAALTGPLITGMARLTPLISSNSKVPNPFG
jgi:hypothetical protein